MAERHERQKDRTKDRRNADVPGGPGRTADPVRVDWDPIPGIRETIESIVVAFTLALLFRGFEAEAFVIPTGSMAPTLKIGRAHV